MKVDWKSIIKKGFFISLWLPFLLFAKSKIDYGSIYKEEGTYFVNVSSQIKLTPNIELSLQKGMQLVFTYEFVIQPQKKLSWKKIATLEKNYFVSYNQTINRFEVFNPVTFEQKEFFNKESMIEFMEHLYHFPLINQNQLSDEKVQLKIRFKLNKSKLPSMVRLESLFKKDWDIDSDWEIWKLPQ